MGFVAWTEGIDVESTAEGDGLVGGFEANMNSKQIKQVNDVRLDVDTWLTLNEGPMPRETVGEIHDRLLSAIRTKSQPKIKEGPALDIAVAKAIVGCLFSLTKVIRMRSATDEFEQLEDAAAESGVSREVYLQSMIVDLLREVRDILLKQESRQESE